MNTLATERLIIRPFTPADLDAAHALLDHDLAWSGPEFSRAQREERLRFYAALAAWDDTGRLYGYRAIILRTTGRLIGICGFLPCLWRPRTRLLFGETFFGDLVTPCASLELEIGYALASAERGRGYATEVARALIQYAFAELGVRRVLATTDCANAGSIRLMQRLGMRTARNSQTTWPGVVGIIDNPACGG